MWHMVSQISTGIMLAAFLAAVAMTAYRLNLVGRVRLIKALLPRDRGPALAKELNAFGVKADGLTREQQYQLALRELELRRAKLTSGTIIIVLLAVISGAVSGLSILFHKSNEEPVVEKSPSAIPFKCNLNPGFSCHYAVYLANGRVRHFSVLSGEIVDVSGISPDDRYCVSTEDPPDNPSLCTSSDKPWRWQTRRVGFGDNFN